MTITEFLLERIAEDEAAARKGGQHSDVGVFARDNYGCLLIQPARVLAECAAKRELVDTWHDEHGGGHVLKTLATVYADHPDYLKKWAL